MAYLSPKLLSLVEDKFSLPASQDLESFLNEGRRRLSEEVSSSNMKLSDLELGLSCSSASVKREPNSLLLNLE